MKKKLSAAIAAIISVLALLGCALWLCSTYTLVGSGANRVICRTGALEIDLSGSSLTSLDGIERVRGLELLDVRGAAIEPEEIEWLGRVLPECDVLWSVPFSSGAVDCDAAGLVLTGATEHDLELVRCMTSLERLEITECELYEQIFALREQLECEVSWSVYIDGTAYPSDTAELTLGAVEAADAAKLRWLPELRYVDATACAQYAELTEVSALLPECELVWQCEIFGKVVRSTDKLLDISGTAVKDLDAFRAELDEKLCRLPGLEKIDMCGCGVSDEDMAALRDSYPQVKFVWLVSFGPANHRYTVRTDVTCFSTLLGKSRTYCGDEDDYKELFLYCTDLVALDMGHNDIADISLISNLKKLQMLIMTDNKIVDLSPLTACEDLFFLEFNKNRVNDITPLTQMKNLKYVTLHYNRVEDITPLYNEQGLEILVLSENFDIPRAQKNELVEALPDCSVYFTLPYGTGTGAEWDSLPERQSVKKAFKNWEKIEEFRSWDDIVWK